MALTPPPRDSGLASLPFDVARMVVWDEQLSLDDVAALRLTCRALATVTATRLFYRIAISKLNKDRDAFLAICHSPHLAPHVHEVEWLEVCYSVNVADLPSSIPSDMNAEEDDTAALCRDFDDQAKASFWMVASLPGDDGGTDPGSLETAHQRIVTEFRHRFIAALDLLPSLHTLTSRQMPPYWVINLDSEYHMAAGLFQRYKRVPLQDMSAQSNDGLFLFLFPAMERPTSTVTRLRWADELAGFSYLRPLPAGAFDHLESLELCLMPSKPKLDASLGHLEAACARAAPTLRRLKLCLDHGRAPSLPSPVELAILGPALARAPSCHLRSLSLVSARCGEDVLFGLFEAHATSLRHVYLEFVGVTAGLIARVAGLTALRLDSIEVVNDTSRMVCKRALARYINGEPPSQGPAMCCFGACDGVMRDRVESGGSSLALATADIGEYSESERGSDAESDASEDSMDYRRQTGPKWAWSRFVPEDESFPTGVYCFQVASSHPGGHATEYWNFTSRDGETACGTDPLDWFEDWDANAGDIEEPLPYCEALSEFWRNGIRVLETDRRGWPVIYDLGGEAWEELQRENPPAGAVLYDEHLDPLREHDLDGVGIWRWRRTGARRDQPGTWGYSWQTEAFADPEYLDVLPAWSFF
ncbi:hypothetical protein C8A05DRAFT_14468 [Staphylotrichum tortipilum]|uniref:F-box domain-containing protein n=1 Tax=Staphylotrichum tortipilum TaxID=2831512 RepID=A0AAN6RU62_9PEZI|nr:hypothetical protein C8A05DRAFT_14468 [Staphylotrichum longicolle]